LFGFEGQVYGPIGLANDARPFTGDTVVDETRRGKSRIKIDRLRPFNDIWKDVMHAFYTRPIVRQWELPNQATFMYKELELDEIERRISIVHISGIVQEALGQRVEGGKHENVEP
jgi:hypothetical protein